MLQIQLLGYDRIGIIEAFMSFKYNILSEKRDG